MAELTDTEQEQAVQRVFGTIGEYRSEKLKLSLPRMVKTFQSLQVIASDKLAIWFKFLYPNFETYAANPSEPLEKVEEVKMEGDDFDMLFYFEGEFFAAAVANTDEIAGWDMNEKRLEFYQATGQTEKLEALTKKLEGENE